MSFKRPESSSKRSVLLRPSTAERAQSSLEVLPPDSGGPASDFYSSRPGSSSGSNGSLSSRSGSAPPAASHLIRPSTAERNAIPSGSSGSSSFPSFETPVSSRPSRSSSAGSSGSSGLFLTSFPSPAVSSSSRPSSASSSVSYQQQPFSARSFASDANDDSITPRSSVLGDMEQEIERLAFLQQQQSLNDSMQLSSSGTRRLQQKDVIRPSSSSSSSNASFSQPANDAVQSVVIPSKSRPTSSSRLASKLPPPSSASVSSSSSSRPSSSVSSSAASAPSKPSSKPSLSQQSLSSASKPSSARSQQKEQQQQQPDSARSYVSDSSEGGADGRISMASLEADLAALDSFEDLNEDDFSNGRGNMFGNIGATLEELMRQASAIDAVLVQDEDVAMLSARSNSSSRMRREEEEQEMEQDMRREELQQYLSDLQTKSDGQGDQLLDFRHFKEMVEVLESEGMDAPLVWSRSAGDEAAAEQMAASMTMPMPSSSLSSLSARSMLPSSNRNGKQPLSRASSSSSRGLNGAASSKAAAAAPAPNFTVFMSADEEKMQKEMAKIREMDLILARKTKEAKYMAKQTDELLKESAAEDNKQSSTPQKQSAGAKLDKMALSSLPDSSSSSSGGPMSPARSISSSLSDHYFFATQAQKVGSKAMMRSPSGVSAAPSGAASAVDKSFSGASQQQPSTDFVRRNIELLSVSKYFALSADEQARVDAILGDAETVVELSVDELKQQLGGGFEPSNEELKRLTEIDARLAAMTPEDEWASKIITPEPLSSSRSSSSMSGNDGSAITAPSPAPSSKSSASSSHSSKSEQQQQQGAPIRHDYLKDLEKERSEREKLSDINRRLHAMYNINSSNSVNSSMSSSISEDQADYERPPSSTPRLSPEDLRKLIDEAKKSQEKLQERSAAMSRAYSAAASDAEASENALLADEGSNRGSRGHEEQAPRSPLIEDSDELAAQVSPPGSPRIESDDDDDEQDI